MKDEEIGDGIAMKSVAHTEEEWAHMESMIANGLPDPTLNPSDKDLQSEEVKQESIKSILRKMVDSGGGLRNFPCGFVSKYGKKEECKDEQ